MKTDSQVQRDVMTELQWEPTIHAAEIGVAVKDGVVTLSGHVDSYAKRWAADRAAKRVSGVKAVTEEIKVTLPDPHRRADQILPSRRPTFSAGIFGYRRTASR